ncbi:MAG: hypothetical protein JWP97_1161 [Labilithrix sp.]|nr:hypothetical protein [Labilithrix sp.]
MKPGLARLCSLAAVRLATMAAGAAALAWARPAQAQEPALVDLQAPDRGVAPPAPPANDADKPIVVWPTLTPAGDEVGALPLHRPIATEGQLAARAQELDATLRDAVQDLGFTLDVADAGPLLSRTRDLDLVERAAQSSKRGGEQDQGTWVVSARLEPAGGDTFLMRILAVPPRGKVLRVRVERVVAADISVRGLVLLRDLLSSNAPGGSESGPRPQESASTGLMGNLRSQGRAVLATNAALFGAFTAFSIQRASGSDDPRLLYPLVTLGTGIGLGGALLVAEEWNIGTGDAWTLAGSAWWGTAAGILVANGQHVQPLSDRYAWGVGGGLIGLTLATFSLTRGHADEGDAVLVTSGASLGLGLGALGDFFYRGNIQDHTPYTGAGIGTAAGLLAGGTVAAFTQVSPSRVLLVDLGAGLGAAAGAAVASPLVFENVTEDKARGFVAATAGGTLLGGGIAWYLTRERPSAPATKKSALAPAARPFGGVIGASQTRTGAEPAYGAGIRGTW